MKIFQYLYYFLRSLSFRGPYKTSRMLYYETYYDRVLNIHTKRIRNLRNLTLAGRNSLENHHYQGASYMVLFELMNLLPVSLHNKPFIDYGCGKARPLFVAEQCGFTNLIGVDIAKELLDDARQNLENYTRKNPASRFDFVFEDATRYHIPEDAAVFYLFNPFGESILAQVAANIKKSHRLNPREIYVIYVNPKYSHVFNQQGFVVHDVLRSFLYKEAILYTLKS